MSTWNNVINTNNHYKIFYADAQTNGMSGDFCKEYRLFDNGYPDDVILDANDTVGAVGNCRIELMVRNSMALTTPPANSGVGNASVVAARVHVDTIDNSKFNGVFLLFDGNKTFTICYGYLDSMTYNVANNTVITAQVSTSGTLTVRWDVITTTDNNYILTKLEIYNGTTWAKLAVTGFNIPATSYTLGKLGIGSCNFAAGAPYDSTFFDSVKIYLPAA